MNELPTKTAAAQRDAALPSRGEVSPGLDPDQARFSRFLEAVRGIGAEPLAREFEGTFGLIVPPRRPQAAVEASHSRILAEAPAPRPSAGSI